MSVTDEMVSRFLSWRLPKDFAPDCGISFKPVDHPDALTHLWPSGTNLLTADQAKAMLEHVLWSAPSSTPHTDHPLRHFDRTCPACVAERIAELERQLEEAKDAEAETRERLESVLSSTRSADELIEWIAGQTKVQHCTPAWCLTDKQIRDLKGKYALSSTGLIDKAVKVVRDAMEPYDTEHPEDQHVVYLLLSIADDIAALGRALPEEGRGS